MEENGAHLWLHIKNGILCRKGWNAFAAYNLTIEWKTTISKKFVQALSQLNTCQCGNILGHTIPALAKNPCKSCWTRKFSKCCTHGHRVYAHQATKCTRFQLIWCSVNATRSKNIQQIHNTIHWDKKFSNNLLKDWTQPRSQSNSQEWHILSLQVGPSYNKVSFMIYVTLFHHI